MSSDHPPPFFMAEVDQMVATVDTELNRMIDVYRSIKDEHVEESILALAVALKCEAVAHSVEQVIDGLVALVAVAVIRLEEARSANS